MTDPQWPRVLEEQFDRLVSAARVTTPSCAHSAHSLPEADVTTTNTNSSVPDNKIDGSNRETTSRPANRDTLHGDDRLGRHHPINNNDAEKNNSQPSARACDNCDISGCHCPGDPETLPTTPPANKVLPIAMTTNTGQSLDRQSPNPPTVLQSTHRGALPDEPPHGERNASRRANGTQPDTSSNDDDDSNPDKGDDHHHHDRHHPQQHHADQSHHDNNPDESATAKANQHAPVATTHVPLTNSPLQTMTEHRADTIEGTPSGPRPVTPERVTVDPASQQAKLHSRALAKYRTRIDNMCNKILKSFEEIKSLMTHKQDIQRSTRLSTIQSIVSSIQTLPIEDTTSSQETAEIMATTVTEPILHCIEQHYHKLINTHLQNIKSHLNNTHQDLINKDGCPTTTAGQQMTDALDNFTNYLSHLYSDNDHNRHDSDTPPTLNNDPNNNTAAAAAAAAATTTTTATATTTTATTTTATTTTTTTTSTTTTSTHLITQNTLTEQSKVKQKTHNRKSLIDRKRKRDKLTDQDESEHIPTECTNPHCFKCASTNIVNLSKVQLSRAQILLLNRGLSFIPTAVDAKPTEIMGDLEKFINSTKRKYNNMVNPPKPPRPSDEPTLPRRRTNRNTQNNNNKYQYNNPTNLGPKALEDAFEAMRMEIADPPKSQKPEQNLTRKEKLALKELSSNHNLIINRADKGSTIVIRHRDDYIQEGLEHLSDPDTYMELDGDRTTEITTTVKRTLQLLKTYGLLSPKMVNFCQPPPTPRTALIYFLKKIHKNPMGIRPIVSTVNSPTANISEFLDFYLQPIMKQLPAYLKDTTQFINEIADIKTRADTWLVTVDVKALYTKIPNEEGIQACREAWIKQELTHPQHPPAEILAQLLELVLKFNTFEFNNKHYLQRFGTAMGSKLAPAYANTFMGKLEKSILDSSPLKPTYYRRFIDDIFMIWPHSETELDRFLSHMNEANESIKFTHEKSLEEIVFLDVAVYKRPDENTMNNDQVHTLHTKTHIKPTNKQLYVYKNSHHPPGAGKGIIIGEAIRFLRTNSEFKHFSDIMMKHKRNLAKRGYNKTEINRHLTKIKFSMRFTKALKKCKTKDNSERDNNNDSSSSSSSSSNNNNNNDKNKNEITNKPVFVTRYCPTAKRTFRIVHKHWTTIDTRLPTLKKFLTNSPRLAYRANTNLAKRLVRAKLRKAPPEKTNPDETTNTQQGEEQQLQLQQQQQHNDTQNDHNNNGTTQHVNITELANLAHQHTVDPVHGTTMNFSLCSDQRWCPLHSRLINSQQARSNISRRTYNTRGTANCDTNFVVYLIQCNQCGKQYVGQTSQSLKRRIARHLKAIRDRQHPGALQEHFRRDECTGIENVKVQPLQVITPNSNDTSRQIEDKLKQHESHWMERLKCEYPQGLNWAKYDPARRYKKH